MAGRTKKLSTADVLRVLDEVDGPAIVTGDIVERYDVSSQTARNRLQDLADRRMLQSRQVGARQKIWYEPKTETTGDEVVVPFGNTRRLVARSPSEETRQQLSALGRLEDSYGDYSSYKLTRKALSAGQFPCAVALRETLEGLFSTDVAPLRDTLLSWWWDKTGVACYEAGQSPALSGLADDAPVIETERADTMTTLCRHLPTEWVSSTPTDTVTVLESSQVVFPACNIIITEVRVSDRRPELTTCRGHLQAIINGEIEDVRSRSQLIGITNNGHVHCLDYLQQAVTVVDPEAEEIEHVEVLGDRALDEWIEHIDNGEGWDILFRDGG